MEPGGTKSWQNLEEKIAGVILFGLKSLQISGLNSKQQLHSPVGIKGGRINLEILASLSHRTSLSLRLLPWLLSPPISLATVSQPPLLEPPHLPGHM